MSEGSEEMGWWLGEYIPRGSALDVNALPMQDSVLRYILEAGVYSA